MQNKKTTVAVIGLGSMGWGAAMSLLRNGFDVCGVDLNPEVRDKFRDAGGRTEALAREAAEGASAVLVFVVNSDQTDAVLFGEDGVLETLAAGSLVMSCSTVPPDFARDLGERLNTRGMLAFDGPVSGGAGKALSGEMTIMGAGSDAAYAAAGAILDAIATKVYRLGDTPGMGSSVKMINQLLAGVHIASACEAMTFGMRYGIDPAVLYEVICNSAGGSWMFENRVPHILGNDYSPKSAVDIFVKDLGIVSQAGSAKSFPLPMTNTALKLFKTASEQGLGREDDAAVAKVYAREGSVKLPT